MADAKRDIEGYGLKPNKALGQNFLMDERAVERIVGAAAEPGLPVIEIGPGLGALTLPIAEKGLRLAAVELDSRLAEILAGKLESYPEARVIKGDVLKTDLAALFPGEETTVAGNLPYYVTTPICERLLTSALPVKRMVLMMQKEAAERFFARPGDKNYGPVTVLADLLYDIETVLELGPGSYYPQPEVSSAVLVFNRNGASCPKLLPRLLKAAFAMRRKTLYNNLPAMGLTKQQAESVIARAGLGEKVRAEAVDTAGFVRLAELIEAGE